MSGRGRQLGSPADAGDRARQRFPRRAPRPWPPSPTGSTRRAPLQPGRQRGRVDLRPTQPSTEPLRQDAALGGPLIGTWATSGGFKRRH